MVYAKEDHCKALDSKQFLTIYAMGLGCARHL